MNYEKHTYLNCGLLRLSCSRWKQVYSSWCWHGKCDCEHVRGPRETNEWGLRVCRADKVKVRRMSQRQMRRSLFECKQTCVIPSKSQAEGQICNSAKGQISLMHYPPSSRVKFHDNAIDHCVIKNRWRMCLQLLFAPLYVSVNAAACRAPTGATSVQWRIMARSEVSVIQLNAALWSNSAPPGNHS